MSASPKVSVILPCYNAHAFLAETLASVKAQTFSDLEIIIVNDGSTDPATHAFLDGLPDDIKIIHQQNQGLPAARNTGIRHASGEYVLPLDCDDWLDSSYIEKTLCLLETDGNADYAYSYLALEGEGNGVLKKSYNFFEQLFFNQMPYCMLIPKKSWSDIGGYDESMRLGYEDWEFNIRLGIHGKFGAVVTEPLLHYRISSAGMLRSISGKSHAQLWQAIQSKHPETYSNKGLYRAWKEWHGKPSTYPTFLLVGWLIVFRILPYKANNLLLRYLLRWFSHASRVSRTTA